MVANSDIDPTGLLFGYPQSVASVLFEKHCFSSSPEVWDPWPLPACSSTSPAHPFTDRGPLGSTLVVEDPRSPRHCPYFPAADAWRRGITDISSWTWNNTGGRGIAIQQLCCRCESFGQNGNHPWFQP